MPRPAPRTSRHPLVRRLAALAATAALAGALVASGNAPAGADAAESPASAATRRAPNPVTPGDFTGYGFDQCLAPDQRTMNRWLQSSPFLAVGIYISGDSRGCRNQPNLTSTWVARQLAKGWRLLPITLGPQASCNPRFPRYGNDETIDPKPGAKGRYGRARAQGRAEAAKSVGAATNLGIAAGSTLWYDLEAFDLGNTHCRESALAFLSAWTWKIHDLGFVSGVYSSAGSGIVMLDDARVQRPQSVNLPDQIWVARWDGAANTSTSYLRKDGWMPHARVKQYQGGHDETWGGVRINIDRDYLDLGRGSVADPESHCGGVRISYRTYPKLDLAATDAATPPPGRVKALQCVLTEQSVYHRRITGTLTRATVRAMHAWQTARGIAVRDTWGAREWMTLLSAGDRPVLKIGSAGPAVRRLQRTLDAAGLRTPVRMTGVFDAPTDTALRTWQHRVGVTVSGVAGSQTWNALSAGLR